MAITSAAGTATFAVLHVIWFGGWFALNGGLVPRLRPFDPFPFNLLTTIVSLEAIFLSIWILISQNRMRRQAEKREHLDLQINMLAEQESTATLRIVRHIAGHLGIDVTSCGGDGALTHETDIERLASAVDESLPDPAGNDSPPGARPTG